MLQQLPRVHPLIIPRKSRGTSRGSKSVAQDFKHSDAAVSLHRIMLAEGRQIRLDQRIINGQYTIL